ncbi:hypothetical protein NQZ68_029816 [Dissostichus eleginoides]|nr:hypothetical protein NQZ68_029816 [Dissostichus eleginoides]
MRERRAVSWVDCNRNGAQINQSSKSRIGRVGRVGPGGCEMGSTGSIAPLARRTDSSWFRAIYFAGSLMVVILTRLKAGGRRRN